MAGALESGADYFKKRKEAKESARVKGVHQGFLRERGKLARKASKMGLKKKAARIMSTTRSSKEITTGADWKDKFK